MRSLLIAGSESQRRLKSDVLFVYKRWSGCYWFNNSLKFTAENEARFMFIGWLLGQSIVNRVSLGLAFPQVLFQKLLLGQDFKVGAYCSLELHKHCDAKNSHQICP